MLRACSGRWILCIPAVDLYFACPVHHAGLVHGACEGCSFAFLGSFDVICGSLAVRKTEGNWRDFLLAAFRAIRMCWQG